MNNQEAQFILQAYRPEGEDAQDPQFAEALDQVRRDPALQRWFDQQQAGDAALSRKLQSVAVPAHLRASILAGHKLIRPRAWPARHPVLTALAASLMLLAAVTAIWNSRPGVATLAEFREDMVQLAAQVEAGEARLQFETADLDAMRRWISNQPVPEGTVLPASLAPGSGLGCRVVEWRGQSVLLACFKLPGGPPAHLLVIDSRALGDEPADQARLVQAVKDMNTTAWSMEDKTYLLVSRAPQQMLDRLL